MPLFFTETQKKNIGENNRCVCQNPVQNGSLSFLGDLSTKLAAILDNKVKIDTSSLCYSNYSFTRNLKMRYLSIGICTWEFWVTCNVIFYTSWSSSVYKSLYVIKRRYFKSAQINQCVSRSYSAAIPPRQPGSDTHYKQGFYYLLEHCRVSEGTLSCCSRG